MREINAKQLEWIENLKCERLSDDPINEDIIFYFHNKRESLVNHLHERAINEETDNTSAYYLVKSPDDEVLLYFSLRCGLLYEDALTGDMVDMCKAYAKEIPMTEELEQKIKDFQIDNSLSNQELDRKLNENYEKLKYQEKVTRTDVALNESAKIKVVLNTMPAIELGHFCKNEHYKEFDKELFNSYRLGEIIFWFKILPLIEEVFKKIGGQFIYLFAADEDENRTLTNHYKTRLKFDDQTEWGVNKPAYDNSCRFLCLRMAEALEYKKTLISNFNVSEEDII